MHDETTEIIDELYDLLGNRVFGAVFTKRDGTRRTGSFRLGVKRHLTGVGSSYDRKSRGHLTVFDMNRQGYRTIRLDSLESITVGGDTFAVSPTLTLQRD